MSISQFGKEARRLRIEKDLLLKDVAERIGVAPAFLSAVESGRKSIPAGFVERIARAMALTTLEEKRLGHAADVSAKEYRLAMSQNTPVFAREAALMLARNFDSLTEEDFREIRSVLDRRKA